MKFLIAAFVLISASTSFATSQELLATCKLSTIDPEVLVEGTTTVTKSNDIISLAVVGQMGEVGEEVNKMDYSDTNAKSGTFTGEALAEILKTDDGIQVLAARLPAAEKAVELVVYQGKGFEEDGAGLVLNQIKGSNGTVVGLTYIGWGAAYCD